MYWLVKEFEVISEFKPDGLSSNPCSDESNCLRCCKGKRGKNEREDSQVPEKVLGWRNKSAMQCCPTFGYDLTCDVQTLFKVTKMAV